MYRLGVVYIMNDDSLSPVFNLRGHNFGAVDEANYSTSDVKLYDKTDSTKWKMNYLDRDSFLSNGKFLDNTMGVFRNPDGLSVIQYAGTYNGKSVTAGVRHLYYEISFADDMVYALKQQHVKGYFFVRQKRIPTILCQGMSVGIDETSHVPMLFDGTKYFTESFLNSSRTLVQSYKPHVVKTSSKQCSSLLSIDPCVNASLKSTLDGSSFVLKKVYEQNGSLGNKERHY